MIVQISDHEGKCGTELCICEFQGNCRNISMKYFTQRLKNNRYSRRHLYSTGEVEGELPGNELGKITISEVS